MKLDRVLVAQLFGVVLSIGMILFYQYYIHSDIPHSVVYLCSIVISVSGILSVYLFKKLGANWIAIIIFLVPMTVSNLVYFKYIHFLEYIGSSVKSLGVGVFFSVIEFFFIWFLIWLLYLKHNSDDSDGGNGGDEDGSTKLRIPPLPKREKEIPVLDEYEELLA